MQIKVADGITLSMSVGILVSNERGTCAEGGVGGGGLINTGRAKGKYKACKLYATEDIQRGTHINTSGYAHVIIPPQA